MVPATLLGEKLERCRKVDIGQLLGFALRCEPVTIGRFYLRRVAGVQLMADLKRLGPVFTFNKGINGVTDAVYAQIELSCSRMLLQLP